MTPFILYTLAMLVCLALGSCWTLWVVHVTRTGSSPLPHIPKIQLFGRRRVPDDDEDEPTNGQAPRTHRVGP